MSSGISEYDNVSQVAPSARGYGYLSLSELQSLVVKVTGDGSFLEVVSKDALVGILDKANRDQMTTSIDVVDSSLLIRAAPGVEHDTLRWSDVMLNEIIATGSFGVVHTGSIFGTPCAI
ncbi:MAG: hypothetical protein Q8P67_23210, partial [archaeon]|nr:hypothetical protein [archaeon]